MSSTGVGFIDRQHCSSYTCLSPSRLSSQRRRLVSKRLFVEVAAGRGGLGTLAPTPAAAASTAAAVAAPAEVAAAPAVVLGDLGGGEAQAGPDLVGDDLDDVATIAVTILVATLLEATGAGDAR